VDSPEGESGRAPTVYQDIYHGKKLIAERILFTEAEKLIQALNRR